MTDLQSAPISLSPTRVSPSAQDPSAQAPSTPALRARTRRVSRRAVFALVLVSAACERAPQVSAVDSLLERDLTLAAANPSNGASAFGDTAANTPSTAMSPRPTQTVAASPTPIESPARPRPKPPETPRRAPVQTTAPAQTPAAAPATAPVPATVPSPAPSPDSSTATSAGATNTPSTAGRRAIGAGTSMVGVTNAAICSIANRPGDRLVAALSNEVVGPDGSRLVPGTPILVEMAAPNAGADFAFRVKAIQVNGELIPVEGTVAVAGETTDRRVSKGGDKGKVITGAIAGAILGRVLGGGTKGAVIGAAGGAAAGTAAAARNSVTEKCLPAGATLTVTLTSPLVLTPGSP